MKKYRFRLETVLRVRRIQEEQARYALLEANRAALRAAEEVVERRNHLDDQTAVPMERSHDAFMAQRDRLSHIAGSVRTAAQREMAALEVQSERRTEWGAHAQRVASLERLDERAREAYAIEAVRDEMKTVDDIVTGRYARTAQDA